MTVDFAAVGRLPVPGDNVAIATQILPAGTQIMYDGATLTLSHTVLEGHRFAVEPIAAGDALRSWDQAFGKALADIQPGDYVCNDSALRELGRRVLDFQLPEAPNFADEIAPFVFDKIHFQPSESLPLYADMRTFKGYRRPGNRGVGTRNMIVLLGTSSLTAGFVRSLETQLKPLAAQYPNIDSIVAVAHTEGADAHLNNRDLLLRTLAGFVVHPNVGAVLAIDYGSEPVTNMVLRDYMRECGYALDDVLHSFMSLTRSFQDDLNAAMDTVKGWLEPVNAIARTDEPVRELKIALQCGGSDAFSGVSGNPLAAWVAKQVIRYGGAANHAETDELIGAEAYMLDKVRDVPTAEKFLSFVQRYRTWAGWHGQAAEGNPSGGNIYRGLYNIYLKSLGAAAKRDPEVRLDYVIDYGEPMQQPGFYFMDSPGNDLESIAGQIASGCNMIFFVTGNGSITNFPFVPTIKIVTTTERYKILPNEMDINAGAYLDGTPLPELGAETFDYTLAVASGKLSVGEIAGHAQVQIWRNWQQTGPNVNLEAIKVAPAHFSGKPLPITAPDSVPDMQFTAYKNNGGYAGEQVGLILPTSLCSGQIARLCVDQLNEQQVGSDAGIARFVTLVHTEGCGVTTVREFHDTMIGYLAHPMVKHVLLLEHGCEKTHNAYLRQLMLEHDLNPAQFGWASVQLDGGIHNVIQKMSDWFTERVSQEPVSPPVPVGLDAMRIALMTQGAVTDQQASELAQLTQKIVGAGGSVIVTENDVLLQNALYRNTLALPDRRGITLGYARHSAAQGFHIMEMPTRHWGEMLTGMGAAGASVILAHVGQQTMPGHPMIPVLQVSAEEGVVARYEPDLDAALSGAGWSGDVLALLVDTLSGQYTPKLEATGNTDFQITRGLLGVSL